MKCEFQYCIYNKRDGCVLDEIGIDALGMCDACIIISVDSEFLGREKERQLAEIERRQPSSLSSTVQKGSNMGKTV